MEDVKSTIIVPIGVYCFVLALYFFSLAVNNLFSTKDIMLGQNVMAWLPIGIFVFFAIAFTVIGFGIMRVDNVFWKVLFFSLMISVASIASLILAAIIFLFINATAVLACLQVAQFSSVEWFSFLAFFLSQIIVLYYLAQEEIVARFGGMGDLISPF